MRGQQANPNMLCLGNDPVPPQMRHRIGRTRAQARQPVPLARQAPGMLDESVLIAHWRPNHPLEPTGSANHLGLPARG
jgi:hypothetical protein